MNLLGIDFEEKAFYDILKALCSKYDFTYPEDKLILLAQKVNCSVINAGDGWREHPTQALLDALTIKIKKGKIEDLSEEKSIQQFKIVMNRLGSNRYHQYEISNYALEGYQSKHNSSYWYQKPYLGIGPSAHSFYESKRTFNISSISKYIKLLGEGKDYFEVEELTEKEFFNEFIMTRLRTSKGLDRRDLEIIFPKFVDAFKEKTSNYLRGGQLAFFGDEYRLTPEGKLMADYITSEFFEV